MTAATDDHPGGEDLAAGLGYDRGAAEALLDLSAPQQRYVELAAGSGVVEPMPGMMVTFARANTEYVLRNADEFSSAVVMGLGADCMFIPLNIDPPEHSKYRKLLDPLFSPRRMDDQEEDITRRVNEFIDRFIERGECNFTEEFAEVFPASVFLGLMGLPEGEMRMFLDMRDGILHPEKVDPLAIGSPEARRAVTTRAGDSIWEYFGALVRERTERPGDDIISGFVQAEIDGERLTPDDIVNICYLLLIAGLDTVSDTLTCSYAFLAQNPEHRRRLADDPSIVQQAVEELLRWESPVAQGAPRVARCPVVLPSGASVAEGTMVLPGFGAANVDGERFDDPLAVQFDRKANPHLAFGGGVHRCLGSHLARRELRITLREWHRRIPDYWLTPGFEALEYPPGLRRVKDLMLAWA
ncbi:MAG: cytochrome P450 [Acidimicrobiia bacterium]